MNADNQRIQDLLKTVEQRHEDYLRSLRSLYETTTTTSSAPAGPPPRVTSAPSITTRAPDSRTTSIAEVPSPPLRALTFASDVLPLYQRPRRATLDAPERPAILPSPSPRPLLPVTPNPGAAAVDFDDDISFIPLLDLRRDRSNVSSTAGAGTTAATTAKRAPGSVDTRKFLAPARFTDDMFLGYLRDAVFTEEMAAVLEEALRRRHEIDGAASLREFAAFERESYISSTFEAYEVGEDGAAARMSVDADVGDVLKYTGDMGPVEEADGVIDAPVVWDALKSVNASGDAVGRITYVHLHIHQVYMK